MDRTKWIWLFCILFTGSAFARGQSSTERFIIDPSISLIDPSVPPFHLVQAGDTLFLQPGPRSFLLVRDISGLPGKPVVFINDGGKVIIDTDHYFGISFQNCRYIRLTGTGDPNSYYGIAIDRVANGGGIGLGSKSSDYEIDHVSIRNCHTGGINAKTDPNCNPGTVRGAFTQYNTSIHDNLISDVGDEAMYIGSTKYFGQTVHCNGQDTLLLPSLLDGVEVYNNIVMNSGLDGIQVSSASNRCNIHHNLVLFDSRREMYAQMSGITIGGGSCCDCYNNYISRGNGNGIEIHGLGGFRVFNNIIVDAGLTYKPQDTTKMRYGIYVSDVTVQPDSSFLILFNTIINPKSDGIRFNSKKSSGSKIISNCIINPGTYEFYENGNTSFNGEDAYVMVPSSESDVMVANNYYSRNPEPAGFVDTTYALKQDSPLVDQAYPDNFGVQFDYFNHPRTAGANHDIGAAEYGSGSPTLPWFLSDGETRVQIYPNPAERWLTVECISEPLCSVEFELFDLHGKRLADLTDVSGNDGKCNFTLDLHRMPAGIYVYTLKSGNSKLSGKLMVRN